MVSAADIDLSVVTKYFIFQVPGRLLPWVFRNSRYWNLLC